METTIKTKRTVVNVTLSNTKIGFKKLLSGLTLEEKPDINKPDVVGYLKGLDNWFEAGLITKTQFVKSDETISERWALDVNTKRIPLIIEMYNINKEVQQDKRDYTPEEKKRLTAIKTQLTKVKPIYMFNGTATVVNAETGEVMGCHFINYFNNRNGSIETNNQLGIVLSRMKNSAPPIKLEWDDIDS